MMSDDVCAPPHLHHHQSVHQLQPRALPPWVSTTWAALVGGGVAALASLNSGGRSTSGEINIVACYVHLWWWAAGVNECLIIQCSLCRASRARNKSWIIEKCRERAALNCRYSLSQMGKNTSWECKGFQDPFFFIFFLSGFSNKNPWISMARNVTSWSLQSKIILDKDKAFIFILWLSRKLLWICQEPMGIREERRFIMF